MALAEERENNCNLNFIERSERDVKRQKYIYTVNGRKRCVL